MGRFVSAGLHRHQFNFPLDVFYLTRIGDYTRALAPCPGGRSSIAGAYSSSFSSPALYCSLCIALIHLLWSKDVFTSGRRDLYYPRDSKVVQGLVVLVLVPRNVQQKRLQGDQIILIYI